MRKMAQEKALKESPITLTEQQKKEKLSLNLLLALLNSQIVKRQLRSKQFTRDIIDTLGKRLFEIIIPIPKDKTLSNRICRRNTNCN